MTAPSKQWGGTMTAPSKQGMTTGTTTMPSEVTTPVTPNPVRRPPLARRPRDHGHHPAAPGARDDTDHDGPGRRH